MIARSGIDRNLSMQNSICKNKTEFKTFSVKSKEGMFNEGSRFQ